MTQSHYGAWIITKEATECSEGSPPAVQGNRAVSGWRT